jgi:tyrosine-protein phosphatase YwqE
MIDHSDIYEMLDTIQAKLHSVESRLAIVEETTTRSLRENSNLEELARNAESVAQNAMIVARRAEAVARRAKPELDEWQVAFPA